MSGEWDPLIIAFLGDLLSERGIPLLVIDKNPEISRTENDTIIIEYPYIIKELVNPKIHYAIALEIDADKFMKQLTQKFDNNPSLNNHAKIEFTVGATEDEFWYGMVKDSDPKITNSVNLPFSGLENKLENKLKKGEKLDKFAQLGLKSYWLGIRDLKYHTRDPKYHTRYNHSVGVMKIASYLYDRAIENSGYKENLCEKQFLRLAALLHDTGHLPFSHLIEDVFKELNWKPAGYKDYYSHTFQTDEKIEELFAEKDLKQQLKNEIGYNLRDLINLVNGCFGVGYLDAIITSPLDADKIDYVFRDTSSTDKRISLSPIQFLEDIATDLIITPEKYLSFSGVSAKSAVELLQTRKHLYQNLYLQSGIVILEGIVKLIIKTYFVHSLILNERSILDLDKRNNKEYPDLGDYKISYCISNLRGLLKESINPGDDNIELKIVELMFNEIEGEKRVFRDIFFANIKKGFATIKNTDNEDKLKALESKIIRKRFNWQEKLEKEIKEIVRDVMFRMPGAAIIEVSRLPEFLSTADSRKERERSDGTKTFAECILMPDGDCEIWNAMSKAAKSLHESSLKNISKGKITVFLYPLSEDPDDSYFKQTLNLFDKLLDKKGISLQE